MNVFVLVYNEPETLVINMLPSAHDVGVHRSVPCVVALLCTDQERRPPLVSASQPWRIGYAGSSVCPLLVMDLSPPHRALPLVRKACINGSGVVICFYNGSGCSDMFYNGSACSDMFYIGSGCSDMFYRQALGCR